ncbi:MAG: hypothetical protein HY762_08740 [Planctomycetes bacterium]|nr:hypothetical protein [Planctomycetota bacterium]
MEGRYSVLSPVGLLPAACTGIDIKALLKGAATVDKALKPLPVSQNPAFLAALVNYLYDIKKNKNILVLMPYAHQLKGVAEWFRQLYPESLGKRFDTSRNEVNVGPTVLDVLGTTDQHSQIQLYNEGPNNKLVIFIEVGKFAGKISIPKQKEDDFLGGHSLAELMNVEKRATEYALVKNQRPNYTIKLDAITPETVGGLLYFLELVTAYAGKLYKVNPYNQPGVEAGKRATFGLLGRPGFEREIADINKTLTKDSKWMISV